MKKLITIIAFTLLSITSVSANVVGNEMLAADCSLGKHPMGSRDITGSGNVIPSLEVLLTQSEIEPKIDLGNAKGTAADR